MRRRLTAGLAGGGARRHRASPTLVAVSAGATPGDPLYGLKRGTEQTQLALSGSDRGLTLLGFAHTRLTELASLTGSGDTALAVATLRDMDAQTTAGPPPSPRRAVAAHDPAAAARRWPPGAPTRPAALSALRPQLPAGAQPAADQTVALLTRVTDRGTALATAIDCATGPAVGGTDPLGPVPLTCAVATANAPTTTGGATGGSTGSAAPSPAARAPSPAPPASRRPDPRDRHRPGGTTGSGTAGTGGTGTGGTGAGGTGPVGGPAVGRRRAGAHRPRAAHDRTSAPPDHRPAPPGHRERWLAGAPVGDLHRAEPGSLLPGPVPCHRSCRGRVRRGPAPGRAPARAPGRPGCPACRSACRR